MRFKVPISEHSRIMERLSHGESQTAIAKEFGVTQSCISEIRKKYALAGNGGEELSLICDNTDSDKIVSDATAIRTFINKAWQSREDAIYACVEFKACSGVELGLAIDAAEGAATAWKRVARELEQRRSEDE